MICAVPLSRSLLVVVAAVVVGLVAAACGDDSSTPAVDAAPFADAPHNGVPNCGLARKYASVEELECGNGPDGIVLCHWTLEFGLTAADSFQWRYSDVGESGSYSCVGGRLFATRAGGSTLMGRFSPGTDELEWDGVDYRVDLPDAGAALR